MAAFKGLSEPAPPCRFRQTATLAVNRQDMAEKPDDRHLAANNLKTKTKAKPMIGLHQRPAAPAIQDVLGAKLKAYYGEVVSEPIPDRLMALMAELEAQSAVKPQAAIVTPPKGTNDR